MKLLLIISLLVLGTRTEPSTFFLQQDVEPEFTVLPFPQNPAPRISIPMPPRSLPIIAKEPIPIFPSISEWRIATSTMPRIQTTYSQFTQCYTEPMQRGRCTIITTSVPDLAYGNFDNQIQSVVQTGMWLYYENTDYNNLLSGRVYYVLGYRTAMTLPLKYRSVISSVRPLLKLPDERQDILLSYEGIGFTGPQYAWPADVPSFGHLFGKLSSLAIIGTTPWTIFTGESYTGNHMCVYPKLYPTASSDSKGFSLAMYANMTVLGIPCSDSIGSVRKGCWSKVAAKSPYMPLDGQSASGVWGRIL